MKRYLSIVFMFTVLAGCGSQSTVPQDSFYRLTERGTVSAASATLDGVLVVPRFLSDGLLSERPVVYAVSSSPEKLQQYNYHFWIESPARMLQDLTVSYLRKAGAASTVVTPEFRAAGAYELIGKIKRLEQIRGDSRGAVVSLEFGLYRSDDGSLLLLRSYEQNVELSGEGVSETAAALSNAVSDILGALVRDLGAI